MALQHVNNLGASGALSAGIASDADSFTLGTGEGANFPDAPSVVKINSEYVWYEAKVGDTFSTLTRGFDGTTPAAHSVSDTVEAILSAKWFEDTKGIVEAITPNPSWVAEFDIAAAVEGDIIQRGAADWVELLSEKDSVSISATAPLHGGSLDNLVDQTPANYRGQWGAGTNVITFDFGSAKTIGRFVVDVGGYSSTLTKIEYSLDGATWFTDSTPNTACTANNDGIVTDFAEHRTARYFRVTVTSGQYVPDWKEVYFYANVSQWTPVPYPPALPGGAVPGDTVAYEAGVPETIPMTGYTVDADYTYSTQTTDKAVDNDPGTYWQDNGNNGAFYVDIGSDETVERIKVAFEAQAANFSGKTVRISYSDTAITGPWTVEGTYLVGDVHDIDGNGNPGWPIELASPATHRYWRLDTMGAWTKIYWLEFMKSGSASWNPATLPTEIADLDVGGSAPGDGQLLQYNASSEVETVKSDLFRMYCDNIYQGQSPDIVIDGTSSTMQTGGNATKYIIFDYGAGNAKTVTRLILETDSTLGTWKVEGSNDLSSWTELETGIVNTAVDTEESFDLTTTGSYRYYRVSATSGAGWTVLRTMVPVYTVGQWVPLSLTDLKTALDALA